MLQVAEEDEQERIERFKARQHLEKEPHVAATKSRHAKSNGPSNCFQVRQPTNPTEISRDA